MFTIEKKKQGIQKASLKRGASRLVFLSSIKSKRIRKIGLSDRF